MAAWHPFSRFPLFLMGIDTGILALRHTENSPIPWPSSLFSFFPTFRNGAPLSSSAVEEEEAWTKVADYQSIQLLVITAVVIAVNYYFQGAPIIPGLATNLWFTGMALTRKSMQDVSLLEP